MHKFLIVIAILFVSSSLFSQEDYVKLPQAKTKNPSYLFNINIIGNEYLIKSLGTSKEEVKEKVKETSGL
jgi:biopolymer transport protein ExbD